MEDRSPCSLLLGSFMCGSVWQSFRVWIMELILLPVCISVPLMHDESWKSLRHVSLPADYRFVAAVGLLWLSLSYLQKQLLHFVWVLTGHQSNVFSLEMGDIFLLFANGYREMKTQWYLWSCRVEAEWRWVYTAAVLSVCTCVFAWPWACITVSRTATRPCRKSLIREAYLP